MDDPLDAIIADYVQQVEAGQVPDRDELLTRYPELADRLRAFFTDFDRLDRQAGELRLSADIQHTVDQRSEMSGTGPAELPRVRYIGDYELVEVIARGGMGVVYKARQMSLGRLVALKMILKGELATPREVARFRAEAEAAANLDHPHIVPIYEVGEHEGQQYYAMRYIEGGALSGLPRADARREVSLLATVIRAVHHAHQHGVLHRDLKPSNILVDSAGTPQVADFGLAKRLASPGGESTGDHTLTETGGLVGTPLYMAPEQAAGRKDLTVAADVYSLGVILYERLTGQTPFTGDTPLELLRHVQEREPPRPSSIFPGISRDLETICLKCLEKDAAKRYASAEALADDLERWLRGEPIHARPVGRIERAARWFQRNPALGATAALAAFALVAAAVATLAYAVDRASAARRFEDLNQALVTEGKHTKDALRETNRQLATISLERAQSEHRSGETGRALLQMVEAVHFARLGDEKGIERSARTSIGTWQAEIPRHRSLVLTGEKEDGVRIGTVAFTPDGRAALAMFGKSARLIDPETGRPLGPSLDCSGFVTEVALSSNGRTAATHEVLELDLTKQVRLWDAVTGKAIGSPIKHPPAWALKLQGLPTVIMGMALSPDGNTLVTAANDGTVRRWDVRSAKEMGTALALGHPGPIAGLAFSPDGRVLAANDLNKRTIRLWDAHDGKAIGTGLGVPAGAGGFTFSADGKILVTAGLDGVVRIWDIASGSETARIDTGDGHLHCCAFNSNRRMIVTGSHTGVVRVWDVATSKALGSALAHPDAVRAVTFQPNDRGVLTWTLDGTIRAWDLGHPPGAVQPAKTWKTGALINALAFHPDGHSILTGLDNNEARFWDVRTKAPVGLPLRHPSPVRSAVFSPDGKHLLTSCWTITQQGNNLTTKGEVYRWDAATGKALGRLVELPEQINYAVFLPGAKSVLVASWTSLTSGVTLRLFDAMSGKPLGTPFKPGSERADCVAVSPDGKRVVIGSHLGQSAQLWDLESRKPLGPPLKHADWVMAVAFSPDGRTFATGCKDKVARLWDAESGKLVGKPMVHTLAVNTLTFSPDGKTLATGCEDVFGAASGEVRIWDATSGESMAPPKTLGQVVSAIAFAPDGETVAVATSTLSLRSSGQGDISIWSMPAPVSEDVERLRLKFQVWTGLELRDSVVYRPLPPEVWLERKRELDGFGK